MDIRIFFTKKRKEMTAAFDPELRRWKHEFNLKMDEMCTVVLSHDLKMKLLCKEAEARCQALKASHKFCRWIQTQLQHKDQEIKTLTAVKDCRIKELQDEAKRMETKLKKREDDGIKSYENVVQALRECDAQLEAQRQVHTVQLQRAEELAVRLQENVDALAAQLHCTGEDQQRVIDQKDETIQRLRTEVETTRTGWDKYVSHVSSEMVVKDTEIIALQERESKLRTELERSREEMERYKQQLSAGLKRERALEQMRVQVELEWQRHCEDVKVKLYLANEQLIQELTRARDQAKVELKEKEEELQEATALLHSVKAERDQAVQGLTPKVEPLASEEIRRLQEQNSTLRAVVAQMRKDMESLSHGLPHPHAQPQAFSTQPVQHPGPPAATSTTSQMAAGPPPQSTDISTKGSPAGGVSQDKQADTSILTKQDVTVAHPESAHTNVTEQSAVVQQLQEENRYLKQQQQRQEASALFENVQGASSDRRLLRTRLKQAASCIARLSREKQQLIELCNRLRAQITTAGQQEHVEPEKEKQGDQHDRLSALEQLQYQLTTQELQYALRQRGYSVAEQLRGPTKEGAANPWSGHRATDGSESSRNKENTPPVSVPQTTLDMRPQSHSDPLRPQLSSEGSLQSLNELWEMLDHKHSLSIFSEGKGELSSGEVAASGGTGVQMMVHGTTAPIHSQSTAEAQQRTNPSKTPSHTTKTSRPGAPGKMSKIRNYNIKD